MNSYSSHISNYLLQVSQQVEALDQDAIQSAVDMIWDTYQKEKTIYLFGNGGSSAMASHACGDFLKGLSHGLEKRFKAICLSDNTPGVMAWANDEDYADVFVEPLKNFLTPEDLVIGFSGSGNSPNVVKAFEYANHLGSSSIAFCGFDGGQIKNLSTLPLHVNIQDMEISEDIHLILFHCIKQTLMKRLGLM